MFKLFMKSLGVFAFLCFVAIGSLDEVPLNVQTSIVTEAPNVQNETWFIFNSDTNQDTIEFVKTAYINVPQVKLLSVGDESYRINGSTSDNCYNINVKAVNVGAGLSDSYNLTEYSFGDTQFSYGVKTDWNNLGEGTNFYKFTAFCEDEQVVSDVFFADYIKPQLVVPSSINKPVFSGNSYINVDGYEVQSPTYAPYIPVGASAKCRDGTYSFSRNRRGTCSHHGGVSRWL